MPRVNDRHLIRIRHWQSSDGRKLALADMETDHLHHCLAKVHRKLGFKDYNSIGTKPQLIRKARQIQHELLRRDEA